jgi:hypothetical protein
VTAALAGVAAIAIIGAIATVSAREARLALTGLVVALVAAPFVADPLPDVRVVALRVVGGVLAAQLLWPAVRAGVVREGGSFLGWRAEALLATAAAICGWAIVVGLAGVPPGTELPVETGSGQPFDPAVVRFAAPAAAGLAMLALAATPVLVPPDPVRLGLGLLLLIEGVTLLRSGLGGAPEPLEQIAIVAALVAVAAGVAGLSRMLIGGTDRAAPPDGARAEGGNAAGPDSTGPPAVRVRTR